jgi:predicted PurR-regulated permease PerM
MPAYVPKLTEGGQRWVRFGILVAVLVVLCWLAHRLRTVFTPLLVGAVIAYIFNPVVTWLERRRRVPRLATVIVIFTLLGMFLIAGGFYVVSKTATQITEFQERLPTYIQTIGGWVADVQTRVRLAQPPAATAPQPGSQPATQNWWSWAAPSLQTQGVALARAVLDYLADTFANLADLVALLVLVPVFTFYFLWRFNDLVQVIHDHLPAAHRSEVVHIAATIDEAIAGFFRGRFIICVIVGTLTAIGWSRVGVPYSVLLGLLTGVLNLVPGLSLLALPPGLLFTFLSVTQGGGAWLWPVTLTMAVFLGVQALDAFVLNPLIAGRSSGLHVLVIVVALLIGARLGGVVGLLLAIPVASTLTEIRRLAQGTVTQGPGASV